MSMDVYDENCDGCKPTLIDSRTSKAAALVVGSRIRKAEKE